MGNSTSRNASRSRSWRRTRVERGIYLQPNGKYAVCFMIDGRPRFRTVSAATLAEARKERELLSAEGRLRALAVSPRSTFADVAARWLSEFELRVAAGERRERTLDLYRSQLARHLLPRLGGRRLQLITTDEIAQLVTELQAEALSPWTVRGVLVPLSCVFGFAVRRGLVTSNPLRRLEPDERPHPPPWPRAGAATANRYLTKT